MGECQLGTTALMTGGDAKLQMWCFSPRGQKLWDRSGRGTVCLPQGLGGAHRQPSCTQCAPGHLSPQISLILVHPSTPFFIYEHRLSSS